MGIIVMSKGFYAALAQWHGVWSNSGVNAKPAYLLEARIRYADGEIEIIKTDETWKTAETPYVEENPVYFGHYGGVNNRPFIRYDAGREIDGWNTASFDDTTWKQAVVVVRSDYHLYAQLVLEEKEMEQVSPVSVVQNGDRWIVDFGKCLTGWPKIRLHHYSAGDQITIQYREVEKGWRDAGLS